MAGRLVKLTFVDAGILIAAARGGNVQAARAMDALHVAAAASVGASELITTEKPSRSIHRARAIKVVTIYPEG
jgi:predicted nucleic acid-binding protein